MIDGESTRATLRVLERSLSAHGPEYARDFHLGNNFSVRSSVVISEGKPRPAREGEGGGHTG